jgi:hypothetical protein
VCRAFERLAVVRDRPREDDVVRLRAVDPDERVLVRGRVGVRVAMLGG